MDDLHQAYAHLQLKVERLNQLPSGQFLRQSNRLFRWILTQEEFIPFLQDINQEFEERMMSFREIQKAHAAELKDLYLEFQRMYPELQEKSRNDSAPPSSFTYLYSLQRFEDILDGLDIWGQITPLEDARYGDDPTSLGQAFGMLWTRLKPLFEAAGNKGELTEATEQAFLRFFSLQDRQQYVVTEHQEWLQTHVTQALRTFVFIQNALNAFPKTFKTLQERISHFMGSRKVSVQVKIREEARGEREPDLHFHQEIKDLWSLLLDDFADRLKQHARRLRGEKPLPDYPFTPPVVLFMTSNPADNPLWTDEEHRKIQQELRQAPLRNTLRVVQAPSVRSTHLLHEITQHQPRVLHFSGHGTQNTLCFVGDRGEAEDIDHQAVLRAFRQAHSVEVLVLVACDSEGLAKQVAEFIPVAIGMEGQLEDAAAAEFSSHL